MNIVDIVRIVYLNNCKYACYVDFAVCACPPDSSPCACDSVSYLNVTYLFPVFPHSGKFLKNHFMAFFLNTDILTD